MASVGSNAASYARTKVVRAGLEEDSDGLALARPDQILQVVRASDVRERAHMADHFAERVTAS